MMRSIPSGFFYEKELIKCWTIPGEKSLGVILSDKAEGSKSSIVFVKVSCTMCW